MKNENFKNQTINISKSIAIKGEKMTANSNILQCFVSPYNATVIELLKKEGINFKYSDENWEFDIKPALGNLEKTEIINEENTSLFQDFSGMPRIKAQYNNKYCFKPTYGSISRNGVASVANSFEQLSITSDTLENILDLLKVISKFDEKDLNSIKNDNFEIDYNDINANEIKIAVPKEVYSIIKNEEIFNSFEELLIKLKDMGITIETIDTDFLLNSLKTSITLSNVEISSNMSRYDALVYGYRTENYDSIDEMYMKSRDEGLGKDVKTRILLGNYLIGKGNRDKFYDLALETRKAIGYEINNIFDKFDLIMLPTTPYSKSEAESKENLVDHFYNEIFTSISNLCGNPTMQVPTEEGIGISLIGKLQKDIDVFKGSKLIEEIVHGN